jgi:hypothetical protein
MMATNTTPLDYYRKYLDDPNSIQTGETPQATPGPETIDINISYYRKYLVDPPSVGS